MENITFSNITIDHNYKMPVRIEIMENNLCTAIRNIYFSNVHSHSLQMPMIKGRPDCHVQNVYFTDCHFAQLRHEDIPTKFAARMAKAKLPLLPPDFRCVDNLVLNNTVFSVL